MAATRLSVRKFIFKLDGNNSNSFCFVSAMEELIVELQLFLQLLDHEYLTSTVREKKAVLNNILLRIQSSKGQCQIDILCV